MENQIRIKANIGKEQVVRVNLKQGIDTFSMLSLSVTANANDGDNGEYKRFSSSYGVVVGRVTINGGMGVPNARVSIFVPLMEEDENREEITALYPFKSPTDKYGKTGVRYNLLPAVSYDDKHVAVGTFPTAQMVLDNDIYVEIFEKYYKYTSITNNSGDYMLYGVPTGTQKIHMDVDLSDIGFLSQKPSDFIYQGYNESLFNGNSFVKQDEIDKNPQVRSGDDTITVYPFWGDSEENDIAITRKDFEVPYTITPTAVFMGCAFTDSDENFISSQGDVMDNCGLSSQIKSCDGYIEVMRETPDGKIEVFTPNNSVINSDGVWCVQIPMNLDYIMTDEEGSLIKTTDTTKGIPTRTRARFKLSLNDDEESVSSSTINYYVPSNYNPNTYLSADDEGSIGPNIGPEQATNELFRLYAYWWSDDEEHREFPTYEGINTHEELMRDLLWNCVYSVKNFIPRFQRLYGDEVNELNLAFGKNYSGIKTVWRDQLNESGVNPFPYNKINLNPARNNDLSMEVLSSMLRLEKGEEERYRIVPSAFFSLFSFWTLDWYNVNYDSLYYSNYRTYDGIRQHDAVYADTLAQEGVINYDFYNDWLNGCLYFPRIAYQVDSNNSLDIYRTNYHSYYNGEHHEYSADFWTNGSYVHQTDTGALDFSDGDGYYNHYPSRLVTTRRSRQCIVNSCFINIDGIEWDMPYETRDGINNFIQHSSNVGLESGFVYVSEQNDSDGNVNGYTLSYSPLVRKCGGHAGAGFMTDLILLGSVDENNIFGIPNVKNMHLPSSTCHEVPIQSREVVWRPNVEIFNITGVTDTGETEFDTVLLGEYETIKNFRYDTTNFDDVVEMRRWNSNDAWYDAITKSLEGKSDDIVYGSGGMYRVNGAFWGSAEYTPFIRTDGDGGRHRYVFRDYPYDEEYTGDNARPPLYFTDINKTVLDDANRMSLYADPNVVPYRPYPYDEFWSYIMPWHFDAGRHCILGEGLFFGRNEFSYYPNTYVTKPKSCINLSRICELSVTNENSFSYNIDSKGWVSSDLTGIIGEDQITSCQYRSLFATLNSRPLIAKTDGVLPRYDLEYVNINSFDGFLDGQILKQVYWYDYDAEKIHWVPTVVYHEKKDADAENYKRFRYGSLVNPNYRVWYRYYIKDDNYGRGIYTTNSFYFYFGTNRTSTALHTLRQKYLG